MRKLRVLFIVIVLGALISGAFAFDTSFDFYPGSGTKFKLYCEYPVYMIINWWPEKFNWFDAGILFDSNSILLKTWSIHDDFPNWNNYISWNVYKVWWAMAGWFKEWRLTWVSFSFITTWNIVNTSLLFVDKNWNSGFVYWLETTDDGISLAGVEHWKRDILSNVNHVTYYFVALPCNADWKSPTITNVSVAPWATKVPINQTITFVTYDWDGSNPSKVRYWFSGNSVDDLNNYVSAPSNVDNQEWVNSGSISVKVSCDTCSTPQSNVPASLSISNWDWTTSVNALTWDSERRWYNVSFDAPFSYEVEKQVNVSISVTDNPNENWQTHTKPYNFSFNAPEAPTISRVYPSPSTNEFISPSKNFAISFYIKDDWAGVDTGTVKITIPEIMSGDEVLLSSYVYSWSDLDFQLSWWQPWLWNSWSYIVSFYPKEDFPVSTMITINVEWADLAWTSKQITTTFKTRPSCSFFWCIDDINIVWGDINEIFTGLVLTVTWTNPNSPYPYLTWEKKEILMCGGGWNWISFDWNVSIYDAEWNWIWWNSYTNNELFIIWLDFVYEDWVIKIQ